MTESRKTTTNTRDQAEALAFLRGHPPFDHMQPEHLAFVVERLKTVAYARDEKITDPAKGPATRLHIVMQGRVRGESPSEDEQVSGNTWELVPGECFPVGALLARRPVRTVHLAAEDTVCLELGHQDFGKLLKLSEEFNEFCHHRLSSLLDQVYRQVQVSALDGLGGDTSLNITLGQRLQSPPVTCLAQTPIREALRTLESEHVGSIVITDTNSRPLGVFTLHDLLTRVALPGVGLDQPMERVMTRDPISLPRSAFAFEAAMLMAQYGIHHICVMDGDRLAGVISERDLFSMQRVGLVNLSRAISRAESVETLSRLGKDIHQLVEQMIAQGVKVGQITQIITLLNDRIARRVIALCLQEADSLADISFSWLVFGSEGRREQTLKTDQDNGILFEQPEDGTTPDSIREALLPVARRINEALDRCGYPLCPGNVMAGNPECCLSVEEWRDRFGRWISQGTPEHLLKASIFFDFRVIHGPAERVDELRGWLLDRTARNSRFRRQMADTALSNRPPLGLFRDFRLSRGGEHPHALDLKLNGVTPFVDAARITSLAHGLPATNTMDRLHQAADAGAMNAGDVAAWVNAYGYIQMLRMRKNQKQRANGEALSNHVRPDELDELDRRILKEAFREARKLQTKLTVDYQL